MKTLFSFLPFLTIMFFACNSNAQNKMVITANGVGKFTHTAEKPDLGNAYSVTTKTETVWDEMDGEYTETITTVKNNKDEIVMQRINDYLIEVFSPEFKTVEGIHVGMLIADAVKLMKGKVEVYNPNPTIDFIFTVDDKIAFVVSGDDLKGGAAEFDSYYLNPFDVTVKNFKADAKIKSIKIQ